MLKKSINRLLTENICLLIPFIIYAIYKNGVLIYQKGLINFIDIFKPLFLVLISIIIKILIDLIKYKKIELNYDYIYVILIGMIMPYNINLIIYIIAFGILYYVSLIIDKYININKVCYISLLLILINLIINDFTYLNPLEQNFNFKFDFLDYLFGRNIGGISSTSIIFSLISFVYLINSYYYKKDIPYFINITYIVLTFIYLFITGNSNYLLNSELIFASIFIASLPKYSPYKTNHQIIYGVFIGIISFVLSIALNSIISIYISILLINIISLLLSRRNLTKKA